jgi:hypothetical protein
MRGRRWRTLELEEELIPIAPEPVLTRLEGPDDGMLGRVEVRRRMPVRRVVATSDVAALLTDTQMDPATAGTQTVLTSFSARTDFGDRFEVRAGLAHM